jgi:ribosomal protein L7/L12
MPEELSDEQLEQVADALANGNKIQSIKLYRAFTGKGLKEAKEFIDELIPKLKEHDPEKYARNLDKPAGCGTMVLLFFASILTWYCVSAIL